MPGSANFIGEFYILNGLFQAKIVYAFVAAIGVALAAFYAIRLFQRTMQNRKPDGIESREIGVRDALVVAPLVACILALALYPGLILGRSDAAVKDKIAATRVEGTYSNAKRGGAGDRRRRVGRTTPRRPVRAAGWTGYGPVTRHDLPRPPHRLRRALARDRATGGDLRGAGRRGVQRRPPAARGLGPLADRRWRAPRAFASGSGASARTSCRERFGWTSSGSPAG